MSLTLRALKGLSTCALSVLVFVVVSVAVFAAGCQLSRDEAPAQEEAREHFSELTAPPSTGRSRRARGQSFGLGGLSTLGGGRAQQGPGSLSGYGSGYGRGGNVGEASQAQPSTSSASRRSARRRLARKPKPSKAPMRRAQALMPSAPPPPPPRGIPRRGRLIASPPS